MQEGIRPFAVTHRSVLAIAVPMTIAYLTTPLLGIVDTAVVGQMGDAALLGGLAAGSLAFDVVFTVFNFLRSGTTGLVAQAFGRADEVEQQAVFWRAVVLALVAGVLLALLAPVLSLAGQRFIGGEARVGEAMDLYVRIRMLGAPMTLINYAVLGYVLGRGEGSFALMLQLLLNGVNIVLSILLGISLGWGIAGVAWGTVSGEAVAAVTGVALLALRFRRQATLSRSRLMDVDAVLRMVVLNRDIMIRSFALLAAFALLTRQGAQFGTITLAANSVLMNFFIASAFFLDGFATAAEQLAGRAIGARDGSAFWRAAGLTCAWGFAIASATAAITLSFGDALIGVITTAPDVRQAAADYLPWAALTAVSGVLAFQMDGIFIGATWSRDMRNMMLLSLAVFVAALVALSSAFGNAGIWAALHLFLVVRGLSLLSMLPGRAKAAFQGA
jgi:putative MATE family efflux protein